MIRHIWTPAQITTLREIYPHQATAKVAEIIGHNLRAVYAKAAELGIKKTAEYFTSPASGRTNGKQGIGSRFAPGNAAWNKGMKGLDLAGEAGKKTQFKPGQMPHNWHPIGYERITDDGILQRKVTDTGISRKDFVPVHVLLWVEHNGPLPAKSIVIFKDKNRKNIVIENLECITRAENMRRNSYHNNYPKEVAQIIQLRGALQRKINRREKDDHATE